MKRPPRKPKLRGVKPSRPLELFYTGKLLGLVKQVRSDVEALLPVWEKEREHEGIHDAAPKSVGDPLDKLARKWTGIEKWARVVARNAAYKALAVVDKSVADMVRKAVAVDVSSFLRTDSKISRRLKSAEDANVDLIKSIPKQYLGEVRGLLDENWSTGMRWETLAGKLRERGDVTASRAKLIARDQTSKMNGAFNRERQMNLGIDSFTWRTSEDERVRESHAELDGQIFSWDAGAEVDDEEGVTPGFAINCRCTGEPIIDLEALSGGDAGELFED